MKINSVLIACLTIIISAVNVLAQGGGGTPSPDPIPSWATGAYDDVSVTMTLSIGEHWPPPGTAPLGPVYDSDFYSIPQSVSIPLGCRPGGYRISISTPKFPELSLSNPPDSVDECFQNWYEAAILSTVRFGHSVLVIYETYTGSETQAQVRARVTSPYDLPPARPVPACVLLYGHPGVDTNSTLYQAVAGVGSGCNCGTHSPIAAVDISGIPDRTEAPDLWGIYDDYILKMAAIDYHWYEQMDEEIDWSDADWIDDLAEAYDEMTTLVVNDFLTDLEDYYWGS